MITASAGSLVTRRSEFQLAQSEIGDQDLEYPADAADYQLLDKVGEGASAVVYRARCIPFNTQVAIKLVNLDCVTSGLDLLIQEAKVMRELHHPNVLSLYTAFVSESALWMVLPFINGGPLSGLLQKKFPTGLDEPVLATIARDVLRGLDYLHRHDCMHRDLKASNLLLHHQGRVLLADFGVTAMLERETPFMSDLAPKGEAPSAQSEDTPPAEYTLSDSSPSCSDTMSPKDVGSFSSKHSSSMGAASYLSRRTFCGTMHFMAPEVLEECDGYNQSADIWSFGITLLELAHGRTPFAGSAMVDMVMRVVHDEPPALGEGPAAAAAEEDGRTFSEAAKDFVRRCLCKDPAERPSASQLLQHRFLRQARSEEYLATRLFFAPGSMGPEASVHLKSIGSSSPSVVASMQGGGRLSGTHSQGSELVTGRKPRKCSTLDWRFTFNGTPYVLHFRITSNYSLAAIYLNKHQLMYRKYSFWEQLKFQSDDFKILVPEEEFGPLAWHELCVRINIVLVLEGTATVDGQPLPAPHTAVQKLYEPQPLRASNESLQVLSLQDIQRLRERVSSPASLGGPQGSYLATNMARPGTQTMPDIGERRPALAKVLTSPYADLASEPWARRSGGSESAETPTEAPAGIPSPTGNPGWEEGELRSIPSNSIAERAKEAAVGVEAASAPESPGMPPRPPGDDPSGGRSVLALPPRMPGGSASPAGSRLRPAGQSVRWSDGHEGLPPKTSPGGKSSMLRKLFTLPYKTDKSNRKGDADASVQRSALSASVQRSALSVPSAERARRSSDDCSSKRGDAAHTSFTLRSPVSPLSG